MDNQQEGNVRAITQLFGDKSVVAQGARGELLVSLLNSELGFTIPITISTTPSLTVGSMPSLTIASAPLLNQVCPVLLNQSLLGATDTTVYTSNDDYRDVTIALTNVDSADVTAQISIGTLDDTHSLVKAYPLAVGDRGIIHVPGLANGAVIHGLCSSASKVAIQIWGIAT